MFSSKPSQTKHTWGWQSKRSWCIPIMREIMTKWKLHHNLVVHEIWCIIQYISCTKGIATLLKRNFSKHTWEAQHYQVEVREMIHIPIQIDAMTPLSILGVMVLSPPYYPTPLIFSAPFSKWNASISTGRVSPVSLWAWIRREYYDRTK